MIQWDQFRNISVDDVLCAVGLARRNRLGAEAFFMGLGIGLAGGAVVALMLTPYRGSEAREKLARAGEDLGRTVTQKVSEIKDNLQQSAEHLGQQLGQQLGQHSGQQTAQHSHSGQHLSAHNAVESQSSRTQTRPI